MTKPAEHAPPVGTPVEAGPPPHLLSLAEIVHDNPATAARSPINIERFLGARVAAWAGAVVVLLAVAVFLKFAYDQGWLKRLSGETRLAASYLFAGILLVAGEFVLRRVGRLASVGLFAGGIGTLYLATLAARWPLDVLSPTAALVVATIVVVISMALTYRTQMLAVGVVGVLGGYIAPFMLNVVGTHGLLVPVHLTVLLVVGLGLAGWAPKAFGPLRFVTVILHLIAGMFWFFAVGWQEKPTAIILMAIWWSITAIEAVFTTLQGRSPRACAGGLLAMSLAVASVGAVGVISPSPWSDVFSYIPLALAILTGAVIAQFGGGISALHTVAETADASAAPDAFTDDERRIELSTRTLGLVLWAQFGILLIGGLGVFLRHGALAIAWAAVAVLTLELAYRLRAFGMAIFGSIVLWLAALACVISALLRTLAVAPRPANENGWGIYLPPGFDWMGGPLTVFAILYVAWRWCRREEASIGDPAGRLRGFLAGHSAVVAVLGFVMWYVGVALRTGASLALVLASLAPFVVSLLFPHRVAVWPRVVAGIGFSIVIAAYVLLRGSSVFEPSWLVALAAGPLAVVVGFWLLAGRVRVRPFSEHCLVASVVALALIGGLECFADFYPSKGSARLRSDLAAVVLASIGILTMYLGRLGPWKLVIAMGAVLASIASLVWAIFGALGPRATGVFAEPLILNATVGTGVAVIVALAIAYVRGPAYADEERPDLVVARSFAGVLLVAMPILLVSLILDAALDPSAGIADESTARQAALSAWWGIASVALIALGFARRNAGLRYAGLTGLAFVVGKVLLIDLQGAATIWRVLGLLVAGLGMVATSIVYVRLGKFFDERAGSGRDQAAPYA